MKETILQEGFDCASPLAAWDQFAENEQKYGIVLDGYNESEYTVPLDTNAPDFEERRRRAEMLAHEIRSGRMGCKSTQTRDNFDDSTIANRGIDEGNLAGAAKGSPQQEKNLAGDQVAKDDTMLGIEQDSNEKAVEEWPLQFDAPEYTPLPGGLAALSDEAKAVLPLIAKYCAPSLRRILEETGLVPRQLNVDVNEDCNVDSMGPGTNEAVRDGWRLEPGAAAESMIKMEQDIPSCQSFPGPTDNGGTVLSGSNGRFVSLKNVGRSHVRMGTKSVDSGGGYGLVSDPPLEPQAPSPPPRPSWASIVKGCTDKDTPVGQEQI